MYIKNFTSSDLPVNLRGSEIVLTANATTLVPDGLVTIQELQKLFGKESVGIDSSGSGTVSIMANQQVLTIGKLYSTEPRACTETRLFIGTNGSVDVYGSDSQNIPAAFSNMSCPEGNADVSGSYALGYVPRYIAIKANTGTPEVVITNCKCYEVGSIS